MRYLDRSSARTSSYCCAQERSSGTRGAHILSVWRRSCSAFLREKELTRQLGVRVVLECELRARLSASRRIASLRRATEPRLAMEGVTLRRSGTTAAGGLSERYSFLEDIQIARLLGISFVKTVTFGGGTFSDSSSSGTMTGVGSHLTFCNLHTAVDVWNWLLVYIGRSTSHRRGCWSET